MFEFTDEENQIIDDLYFFNLSYDPFVIAAGEGAIIKYVPFMDEPQGYYRKIDGKHYILLSEELRNSPRRFFVCAHELYHLMYHQGFGHYYISTSSAKYRFEREANKFAVCLLAHKYYDEFDPDLETLSYLDVINYYDIPKQIFSYEF